MSNLLFFGLFVVIVAIPLAIGFKFIGSILEMLLNLGLIGELLGVGVFLLGTLVICSIFPT